MTQSNAILAQALCQNHLFLGHCSAIISFAQNQPIAEAHSGSFLGQRIGRFQLPELEASRGTYR